MGEFGVVPAVKIINAEDAVDVGRALIAGGLPVIEVIFRTEAAEESIKRLNDELPEILLGAGTVLTVDQVKRAVRAGAKFIVAPGFNPTVVDYCVENKIPVIPGVNSPSMIEQAMERGLKLLKFFPAEASGGVKTLKAIAPAYSGISFLPTGGINEGNLAEYLAFDRVYACGGTWFCKDTMISGGRFDEITRLTKNAVSIVLGFSISDATVYETAKGDLSSIRLLSDLLNFTVKTDRASVKGDGEAENAGKLSTGKQGMIIVRTNSIDRALAYFKRRGIKTYTNISADDEGRGAAGLETDLFGFSIGIIQK
jgi:2-dehydro-3-deoxyphosphogluconate aldolase/(4S)-4-hydroxy-2-oxoglutarate aldolase